MPRLKWLHGQLKCRQPTNTGTGHFLINLLNYHPILSFQLSSGINKLATLCNCPDNRPLIDSNKRLVARTRLQRLHSCGELAAVSPAEKTLQMRNSNLKFKSRISHNPSLGLWYSSYELWQAARKPNGPISLIRPDPIEVFSINFVLTGRCCPNCQPNTIRKRRLVEAEMRNTHCLDFGALSAFTNGTAC